ncbi:MAG TPA: zf-TFIIB domain-containing protein [Gemmatirosa sp.]|nr:zf-TFIIB domain-containing protein [Gemmatirosa sp.]
MPDPTTRNEDEYFARESAEQVTLLRAKMDAQREARERASHHMRCPKCGGHLVEREHHRVKIDVCRECNGTWLDAGELEIVEHLDHSAIRRFVSDVIGGFSR